MCDEQTVRANLLIDGPLLEIQLWDVVVVSVQLRYSRPFEVVARASSALLEPYATEGDDARRPACKSLVQKAVDLAVTQLIQLANT